MPISPSGSFRSQQGAERHAILLSIIETAKKQVINSLSAIQHALNGSLVFRGARQLRNYIIYAY